MPDRRPPQHALRRPDARVTDAKRAQERLLHDAVHDSLTALPNRELFLDRLGIVPSVPSSSPGASGAAVHRHRQVQERQHLVRAGRRRQPAADGGPPSADATSGRRTRWPASAATSSPDPAQPSPAPHELAMLAERCAARCARRSTSPARRSCSPPPSASPSTTARRGAADVLKEAEIAMYRAKRGGAGPHRDIQPANAHREGRPRRARERPAQAHREEAAEDRLPADLLSADRGRWRASRPWCAGSIPSSER